MKQERRDRYREWLVQYKQGQRCQRCGISDPRVLDFHHKDGDKKAIDVASAISNGGYGLERIKLEIAKCTTLCANCHRIVHYKNR